MVVRHRRRRRGRSAPRPPRPAAGAGASREPPQPATARPAPRGDRRVTPLTRDAPPAPAVVVEQRHRLELQPLVVQRAAGARQVEARARRPGRSSTPPVELAAGERLAAARAARRGRRAACPPTLATTSATPSTSRLRQRPRPSVVDAVERRPRRRGSASPHRPSGSGRRRAARGSTHALDLEPVEVGRRLLERLLDRQLERRGRRRAAVAAALAGAAARRRPRPEQLDVAAVRLHVRAARCRAPRRTRSSSGTG